MAKITIYGLSGAGKGEVGKLLGSKLNIPYLSAGNLMRQNAEDLGITLAELKEIRKKDPKYDIQLDEYIKNYGKSHENFIIESRLPWYFISDSFKIKMFCDLDIRMKRVAARDNISLNEAKEINLYREKTDEELYKNLYGIEDINADAHFDYIIDTSYSTVEEIVDKIISNLPNQK